MLFRSQLLRDRVNQFASGAIKGVGEDAEAVAEGVSALGLYIAALQQGTTNAREVLLPALIRFGLAEKPADPEKTTVKSPVSENDVDVAKQKVQERFEEWKQQPEQTASRDQLREAVKELKAEASLAADSKAVKQSDDALKAIEATFDPTRTGITEALSEIAPEKPTEAPAAQVVQLIDAPAAEVDQELLEIFLEEAGEVVGTIRENLDVVKVAPVDKEALTTIRRGFHTLKGSGRMVGLNDLGEVAWNCEQVMNKWLKDEKPASPGLIGFIDRASTAFRGWVDALQANGTTIIDGVELAGIAELLKNDKEPDFAQETATPAELLDAVPEQPPVAELPALEPEIIAPAEIEPVLLLEPEPVAPAPEVVSTPATDIFDELPALVVEAPVMPEPVSALSVVELPNEMIQVAAAEPSLSPRDATGQPADEDLGLEEAVEPADVRVGHILVPHALFNIYLGEADQHIATLDNEMSALEAKPMQPVSHDFMRAAHTLTSSSRTTGFDMIADVAHALEKWLQEAIEFPPEFDRHRLLVTRSATDALSSMVLGLHTHEPPTPRPDIVQDLMDLREALKQSKRTGEGTHIKMPGMQSDVPAVISDDVPGSTTQDPLSIFDSPVIESSPVVAEIVEAEPTVPVIAAHEEIDFGLPAAERIEQQPSVEPEVMPGAEAEAEASKDAPGFDPGMVFGAATAAAAFVAHEEPATTSPPVSLPAFEEPAIEVAEPPPLEPIVETPAVQVETGSVFEIPPLVAPLPVAAPEAAATPSIVETKPVIVEAGKDRRTMTDDVDHDLLPIFLEEATTLTTEIAVRVTTARELMRTRAAISNSFAFGGSSWPDGLTLSVV